MVVDIIILIILVFFFISGMKRGLIRQVLDIVGIILAFIGAFYLAHYLAGYFEQSIELPYNISLVVAAVVIFIGILLLFHALGLIFQKIAEITLFGSVDRVGGGLFGAFKGVLLVSLLLVIALNIPLPEKAHRELRTRPLSSGIYPVLPSLFDFVFSHSPSELDFDSVLRSRGRTDVRNALEEKKKEGEKSVKTRKEQLEKALEDLDD
jgi:membrane protein required for colicin V production